MNKTILLFLFCLSSIASNAQNSTYNICKIWYNSEKTAKIQIYKVETKYFGKIVWLKEGKDKLGNDILDENNPDKRKRKNKVIGSLMLTNFTFEGNNIYENGQIYDGRSGKTFNCILTAESESKLKVRGYIGFSILGKTVIWTESKN